MIFPDLLLNSLPISRRQGQNFQSLPPSIFAIIHGLTSMTPDSMPDRMNFFIAESVETGRHNSKSIHSLHLKPLRDTRRLERASVGMTWVRFVHLCTRPAVHLPTCPSVPLSICEPVHLSNCRPPHTDREPNLAIPSVGIGGQGGFYSRVHVPFCPPFQPSICARVHLSSCPHVYLSACPPAHQSARKGD